MHPLHIATVIAGARARGRQETGTTSGTAARARARGRGRGRQEGNGVMARGEEECTSNTGDLFHSVVNDLVKGEME